MALSIAVNRRSIHGANREVIATITFDSSYPTGGEALTAANLGLSTIHFVSGSVPSLGYNVTWAANKLIVWDFAGQLADETDLSASTAKIRVLGQ